MTAGLLSRRTSHHSPLTVLEREIMLINLKNTITELAYAAVNMAEETLDTSTGKEKKTAAIEYIVSMLPLVSPFKGIISVVLSKFIDEAVEKAVSYMKSIKNVEA